MKISIYGASDDLVEVQGCEGADEFDTYNTNPSPVAWRGDLRAPDGQAMRVEALYDDVWRLAFGQVDEDTPLPEWPLTLRQHPEIPYSVLAVIDAPEGTALINVQGATG